MNNMMVIEVNLPDGTKRPWSCIRPEVKSDGRLLIHMGGPIGLVYEPHEWVSYCHLNDKYAAAKEGKES